MKTKLVFFVILLFCRVPLFAQKQNNIWIFGNGKGIDFNSGTPGIITSATITNEGCAAVSNSDGKLLFYSNGLDVWDNTHNLMPNGAGLTGSLSATMGVAITRLSSDTNLYFLFILDAYSSPKTGKLRYSLIDMRLNGGKGDVDPSVKNVTLPDSFMSEKMIVAPACGGVWVITHHSDSALFFAYKITGTMIPPAVKSYTSGINAENSYYAGQMKLSPDSKYIALGNYAAPSSLPRPVAKLEVFRFDINTGKVGISYVIDSSDVFYSVEFSPDGSKLYANNFAGSMYQYNLSLLPSTSAVYASKYTLSGTQYFSSMLAPDNKIYTIRSGMSRISRINDPNKTGAVCSVELDVASLSAVSGGFLSFHNNTARPLKESSVTTQRKDVFICGGEPVVYKGPDGGEAYLWNDGDTSRKRTFTAKGLYWLTTSKDCDLSIDTLFIEDGLKDTTFSTMDTIVCFDPDFVVQVPTEYKTYLWSDGGTQRSSNFNESGTKWVISTSNECAYRIDTFHVRFTRFELNIPDTVICKGEQIMLNADVGQTAQYLWQDNSTAPTFTLTQAGKYSVEVSIGNCKKKEEINIEHKPFVIDLGTDRDLCEGKEVLLEANMKDVSYLWSDGSTGKTMTVRQNGLYTLRVQKGGCIAQDSVSIVFKKCDNCIHIPNAFTPNKDGRNDVFRTLVFCPTVRFSLIIVNRYGEVIFKTDSPSDAWDGTFNHQEQETGVFYYLVKVLFDYPGAQDEIYKGDVSLLR